MKDRIIAVRDLRVEDVKIGTIVKCKFSGDIKRVIKIEGNIVFLDDDSWNYLVSDEVVMPDYVLYDDTVTGKKLTRDNLKPGANILHKFYGFKKRVSKVLADRNEVYYESGGWDYIFGDAGMLDKYYLIEDKKDEVEALIESHSNETYNQTFNDLIDVAVQAYKDGVLSHVDLRDNEIFLTGLGVIDKNRNHVFQSAVNDIKSLYTETFVIECENDIQKIKEGANVELANMNVFIVSNSKHESLAMKDGSKATGLTFKDSNNFWITYSLFELKGATVTQEVSK